MREPNVSDWRRRTIGDLSAAFRFDSAAAAAPPKLPDTAGPLALAEKQADRLPRPEAPRSDQAPPVQEKGSHNRIRGL